MKIARRDMEEQLRPGMKPGKKSQCTVLPGSRLCNNTLGNLPLNHDDDFSNGRKGKKPLKHRGCNTVGQIRYDSGRCNWSLTPDSLPAITWLVGPVLHAAIHAAVSLEKIAADK